MARTKKTKKADTNREDLEVPEQGEEHFNLTFQNYATGNLDIEQAIPPAGFGSDGDGGVNTKDAETKKDDEETNKASASFDNFNERETTDNGISEEPEVEKKMPAKRDSNSADEAGYPPLAVKEVPPSNVPASSSGNARGGPVDSDAAEETEVKLGGSVDWQEIMKKIPAEAFLREMQRRQADETVGVRDADKATNPPVEKKSENTGKSTGVQQKLPVFVKPRIESMTLKPSFQSPGKEYTRAVVTMAARCGATLLKFTERGMPAFVYAVTKFCKENKSLAREMWKIDCTHVLRDPTDDTKVWEITGTKRDKDGTLKKFLQNVFIHFPDSPKEREPEFRPNWGRFMAQVYNSPACQSHLYGNNTLAYYAGDLTPRRDGAENPYLSDYLTIKNTIDALESAYSTKTREEILNDDSILVHFFPKEKLERVRDEESRRTNRHVYRDFQDGPSWDAMKPY